MVGWGLESQREGALRVGILPWDWEFSKGRGVKGILGALGLGVLKGKRS